MTTPKYKIFYMHYRVPLSLIVRIRDMKVPVPRKGRPHTNWLFRYRHIKDGHGKYFTDSYHFSTPWPRGGMTICHIYDELGKQILASGQATCSMSDGFCYNTGRKLSLERAIESLNWKQNNAPQAAASS